MNYFMAKSFNRIKAFGYYIIYEIEICGSMEHFNICEEKIKMLNIFFSIVTHSNPTHVSQYVLTPIYLHLH